MTVRTFLRLALAGVAANVLAAACVINRNDEDACEPSSSKACTCSDGTESQRRCSASGSFGSCMCGGTSSGNASAGGDGPEPAQGGEGGSAGMARATYAGETGEGGGNGTGAAPNENSGGGGADGGSIEPLECQDPADTCEACYFTCCEEWVECFNDDTCLAEFNAVLLCVEGVRARADVKVADLENCTREVAQSSATAPWSAGLAANTVTMVNCLAGDPAESGWNEEALWGTNSCNNSCFKQ